MKPFRPSDRHDEIRDLLSGGEPDTGFGLHVDGFTTLETTVPVGEVQPTSAIPRTRTFMELPMRNK